MYEASKRFIEQEDNDKETMIIHLGDHDPSGIDMTRDIRDRLHTMGSSVFVNRIALTIQQIREHNPPSDPARDTDSRYDEYVKNTGEVEQWELDALEPAMLRELIREEVDGYTLALGLSRDAGGRGDKHFVVCVAFGRTRDP